MIKFTLVEKGLFSHSGFLCTFSIEFLALFFTPKKSLIPKVRIDPLSKKEYGFEIPAGKHGAFTGAQRRGQNVDGLRISP